MARICEKSNSIQDKLFDAINYLFLIIFTFITVFPFYNSVILSLNEGKDALKGGIYFFPRIFTLENYKYILSNSDFLQAAFITVSRTIIGAITSLFFTAAFGYAISKQYLCFRKFYIVFGLITMFFSGGLIPTFILIRNLGLINNFLVYILPNLFSMFNALIFMSFFKSLPAALEESAKIDGASDFLIFIKIIIPVSLPVVACITLFNAVWQWNSWFDTMLYANVPQLDTLSHMFQKMVTAQEYLEEASKTGGNDMAAAEVTKIKSFTSTSIKLAAMVMTTAPMLMLYPFLQKYFVKGIMIGSIKG